jgi:hypothetical protein
MKPILFSFLLAILLCQTNTTSAQTTEPTNYIVFGYHKVNPGMRDDFLKLAKAWKKIVAYKKKSGMQDDWSISRVVMPAGASSEYDYVTRHSFIGEEQLAGYLGKPFLPENWETLLTLDEIKLVLRAEEIRTYVKGEVWSTLDRTVAADIGKSTGRQNAGRSHQNGNGHLETRSRCTGERRHHERLDYVGPPNAVRLFTALRHGNHRRIHRYEADACSMVRCVFQKSTPRKEYR